MSERRDDIEKYLRGELTPAEMHALEKKALSDPFLADALEGASSIDHKDFAKDVDELNRAINQKKSVVFTPLRIAAGIILVIGVSLVFVLGPGEEQEQLAKQETSKEASKEPEAQKTDSVIVKKDQQLTDQQLTLADKPKEDTDQPKPKLSRQRSKQSEPAPAITSFREDSIETEMAEDLIVAAETAQDPVQDKATTSHISGTVTSAEDGLPLPGVTVVVKGTSEGTVTDINGNYSLDVPDSTELTFSFVGMHTNEVRARTNGPTDVKMTEDVSQLSEVVITRAPVAKNENEAPEIKLAEPVGGLRAYDKYLEDNKQYPQQALDNDVKGRVVVGFDVGISGELSNFVVIRSLGYGCDDEVIRLVKEGPQWMPTTEDGKSVESTIHVKMKFDAPKFKARRKK